MARSDKELRPRNGYTLVVGVVARISGGQNQKDVSLDDQLDHATDEIRELYDGPVEYVVISTTAKGERLDRPELAEIENLIRTKRLDVLVMEDVGRLVRGAEAVRLWGLAVDHGTRCIAPHDCCDTNNANWEQDVLQACAEHVGNNEHASKRIKQKLNNRFKKGIGATSRSISGYFAPVKADFDDNDRAVTYDDWIREDEATPVIRKGLAILRSTGNCESVADYFNSVGFKPGAYCSLPLWNGKMVRRFYKNKLLCGKPGRGFKRTEKHFESGRRVSKPNTESEPIYLFYEHLVHVDEAELDAVNAQLDERNEGRGRPPVNGVDPLAGRSRKRSKCPGQIAHCFYCGRHYVWGANGITNSLMCQGPRDYRCWNSIGFDGPDAAKALAECIVAELFALDHFEEQYAAHVALAEAGADIPSRAAALEIRARQVTQQQQNVAEAIAVSGLCAPLSDKLRELEAEARMIAGDRQALEYAAHRRSELPRTVAELRALVTSDFARLSQDSMEFATLIQSLVPEFYVYLVRLRTGGMLYPRARVRLDLSGQLNPALLSQSLRDLTSKWVTLDLFKAPKEVSLLPEVLRLAGAGFLPTQIAAQLRGTSAKMIRKVLELDVAMEASGSTDPYVFVSAPPTDMPKFRRHKNPRFRFEILDGHAPPEII